MYSWMSYPLTALIEIIWEQVKSNPSANTANTMDCGIIELVSCAERALNYLQTGNPAVICTSIMNPLWIGRSIIHDGCPSFNPEIVTLYSSKMPVIKHAAWPYDSTRYMPQSSAEKALIFRFGDSTAGVSLFLYLPVNSSRLWICC